jgi:hypothetical protein
LQEQKTVILLSLKKYNQLIDEPKNGQKPWLSIRYIYTCDKMSTILQNVAIITLNSSKIQLFARMEDSNNFKSKAMPLHSIDL